MMSRIHMIWRKTIRSPAPGMGTSGTAHVLIYTGLGEELEKLELAQRAKTKESVFEGQNLLDRDLSTCGLVHSSSHGSVGAFSETMKDTVVITFCAWKNRRQLIVQESEKDGRVMVGVDRQRTDFELGQGLCDFAGHGECWVW